MIRLHKSALVHHAGTWTEHPLPPRDTEQAEEVEAA